MKKILLILIILFSVQLKANWEIGNGKDEFENKTYFLLATESLGELKLRLDPLGPNSLFLMVDYKNLKKTDKINLFFKIDNNFPIELQGLQLINEYGIGATDIMKGNKSNFKKLIIQLQRGKRLQIFTITSNSIKSKIYEFNLLNFNNEFGKLKKIMSK